MLLGIRNSFKDDACPAELVYGESLRLPGEFFNLSKLQEVSPKFVTRLKQQMIRLSPVPASRHSNRDTDKIRGPLCPPYSGPYKVVSRGYTIFTICINGKNIEVSRVR